MPGGNGEEEEEESTHGPAPGSKITLVQRFNVSSLESKAQKKAKGLLLGHVCGGGDEGRVARIAKW
jgi:hypothetical protein